jgi:hypothetical protein
MSLLSTVFRFPSHTRVVELKETGNLVISLLCTPNRVN